MITTQPETPNAANCDARQSDRPLATGSDASPASPNAQLPQDGQGDPPAVPSPGATSTPRIAGPEPRVPRAYHQGLLTEPRPQWWRGVLALVGLAVAYLVVSVALSAAAIMFDVGTTGVRPEPSTKGIAMTPALYAALVLGLAALTPLSMLLQRVCFGIRAGYLSSVTGRFRWALFGKQALFVVPLLAAYGFVFNLIQPSPGTRGADWVAILALSIVLLPLQAAGEEQGFRGLMLRVAGTWNLNPTIALVLGAGFSSVLFMLAHGAGDPWLNLYYFCFGVTCSLIARYTGGLEGSTLLHAANNVVFGVIAALTTDMSTAFDRSAGVAGPFMLVQVVAIAILGAGLVISARRLNAQTMTRPSNPVLQSN